MKKSKARKIINVLDGMSPEQQKTWMVQNNYVESESDAAFDSAYQSILSAAEM